MEILNSDDDMAGMYLSTKRETGQSRPVHMHEVRNLLPYIYLFPFLSFF